MTDVQNADPTVEPSMEEILASIRRIIADEKDTAPAAADAGGEVAEDVLELTQMVQDDGSVVNVDDMVEPTPAFEVAPPPPPPPPVVRPEPIPPKLDKEAADALLSTVAESATTSSLAALAQTVQSEERAALGRGTPLGGAGRTLEDLVLELMKPMLRAWLDEHLPAMVERIVQKEVERIARRVQD